MLTCCCCDTGDDFNRADSASAGDDWEGEAEIEGNRLRLAGVLSWKGFVGEPDSIRTVRVDVAEFTPPCKIHVFAAGDGTDYLGVEYGITGEGDPPGAGAWIAIINAGETEIGSRWAIGEGDGATQVSVTFRPVVGATPASITASVGEFTIHREIAVVPDGDVCGLAVVEGEAVLDNWICPACANLSPRSCGVPQETGAFTPIGNYFQPHTLEGAYPVGTGYVNYLPHERGAAQTIYGPATWEWRGESLQFPPPQIPNPQDPAERGPPPGGRMNGTARYVTRWDGAGASYAWAELQSLTRYVMIMRIGLDGATLAEASFQGMESGVFTVAVATDGDRLYFYCRPHGSPGVGAPAQTLTASAAFGDGIYYGFPAASTRCPFPLAPDYVGGAPQPPNLYLAGGVVLTGGMSQRGTCAGSPWDQCGGQILSNSGLCPEIP